MDHGGVAVDRVADAGLLELGLVPAGAGAGLEQLVFLELLQHGITSRANQG
jgi:hypothetical protein